MKGWVVLGFLVASTLACSAHQRRDEIETHIDEKEDVQEPASTTESLSTKNRVHETSGNQQASATDRKHPSDLPVVVLEPAASAQAAPTSTNKAKPSSRNPVLLRSEVEEAVIAGPGRLLGFVRVRPYSMKRRFLGFEILELLAPDRRFQPPYLMPGDVILQVNGIRMKQPENLFAALQSLRTAKSLEFDIWRAEKRVIVAYSIEESSSSSEADRSR